EDYEIFDLVSAVEAAEGKGTTFYSWLDVPPTSSAAEIGRAYRKLSIKIHPDKNPNVKGAHERFARLGVVASILRNAESRKRYDFFYKNGVPKWRGTGYYYSRFRPGLGTVSIFLILMTSTLQYIIQRINYKRDSKRVQHIIREAQLAAWGPRLVPVAGQRKVKVNIGLQRHEDGFIEGSKFIDMVVETNAVYILDPSGEMHIVDESTATKPEFSKTWAFALPLLVLKAFTKRKSTETNQSPEQLSDIDGESSAPSDTPPGSGTSTPRTDSDYAPKHPPVAKTGGKRRKVVKRH
ncbi:hypothetical protein AMATHDRAFT_139079, partial [Amanita thiersii Skay4041]